MVTVYSEICTLISLKLLILFLFAQLYGFVFQKTNELIHSFNLEWRTTLNTEGSSLVTGLSVLFEYVSEKISK